MAAFFELSKHQSVADTAPAFGMLLTDGNYSSGSYRFGFNGMEMDDYFYGEGNIYDYGFRIYNPRIGKFLSADPLTKDYHWLTPYQFASNNPVHNIDLDGKEGVGTDIMNWIGLRIIVLHKATDNYIQAKQIENNPHIPEKTRKVASSIKKAQALEGYAQVVSELNELAFTTVAGIPGVDVVGDPLLAVYYYVTGETDEANMYMAATLVPGVSGMAGRGVKILGKSAAGFIKNQPVLYNFMLPLMEKGGYMTKHIKSVVVESWNGFYKAVGKNKITVSEICETARKVAEANGWRKISKGSNNVVYQDPVSKLKFSVDTQHATFEVTDATGKKSYGEVKFNGDLNKKEGHKIKKQ